MIVRDGPVVKEYHNRTESGAGSENGSIKGGTMGIHTVKSESTLKEGMVVENRTRNFTIIADEPTALGGTDTGANPAEMLLCSLGACQCMTAKFFAKAQGIKLKEISISLEGDINAEGLVKGTPGIRPGFRE